MTLVSCMQVKPLIKWLSEAQPDHAKNDINPDEAQSGAY